jgi:recombination protein U
MTQQGLVATLSTVDFYGEFLYNFRRTKRAFPMAFDAKETLSKTSFPLANIHQHQIEYLKLWINVGGVGFFLIHFKNLYQDQAFITPITLVEHYWFGNGRRSIPIKDFKKEWLTDIDDYLSFFRRPLSCLAFIMVSQ